MVEKSIERWIQNFFRLFASNIIISGAYFKEAQIIVLRLKNENSATFLIFFEAKSMEQKFYSMPRNDK